MFSTPIYTTKTTQPFHTNIPPANTHSHSYHKLHINQHHPKMNIPIDIPKHSQKKQYFHPFTNGSPKEPPPSAYGVDHFLHAEQHYSIIFITHYEFIKQLPPPSQPLTS